MKKIFEGIKPGKPILLFLDYDGTLVPIKKSPELALLAPSRRQFLRTLSKSCFLAVVSGRPLAEVKKLVSIREIAYIGNHGLEISYKQRRWVHPGAREIRPALRAALIRIKRRAKDISGVLVEDKGLTGSIHYRLVDPASWEPLKKMVKMEVGSRNRELKMAEGKRVIEIKPNVEWDKGKGVRELIGWLGHKSNSVIIYIGDDKTDEEAFGTLNKSKANGLTVFVGQRKKTQARHRLANVSQVWRFLKTLLPLTTTAEGSRLTI